MGEYENGLAQMDLSLERLERCFSNAAIDIVSTAAGVEIHEKKSGTAENEKCISQVSGVMLLCGEKNGVLSLTMSQGTAAVLVSYMTGASPGEICIEELCDGVAELTNMIAGRAKVDLQGTDYHYNITPPFSIVGENYSTVYKSRVLRIFKRFTIEDMTLNLEVLYA